MNENAKNLTEALEKASPQPTKPEWEAMLRVDHHEWPEGLLSKEAHAALHAQKVTSTITELWVKDDKYIFPIKRTREEFEAEYKKLTDRINRGEGAGVNFSHYDSLQYKNQPEEPFVRMVVLTRFLAARCQEKNVKKAVGRLAEAVNTLAAHGLILGNLESLISIPLAQPMGRLVLCYPVVKLIGDPRTTDQMVELRKLVGNLCAHEGDMGECIDPDELVECPVCKAPSRQDALVPPGLHGGIYMCETCAKTAHEKVRSALVNHEKVPYDLPEAAQQPLMTAPRDDDKTIVFADPKKT